MGVRGGAVRVLDGITHGHLASPKCGTRGREHREAGDGPRSDLGGDFT